jgi:hypothetical protein
MRLGARSPALRGPVGFDAVALEFFQHHVPYRVHGSAADQRVSDVRVQTLHAVPTPTAAVSVRAVFPFARRAFK